MIILKDGALFRGELNLDPRKIAQLVAEGVWTDEDLRRHGLTKAEPFVVPEGKVKVGEPRYEKGKEVYDVEDAPPPPPEPTPAEKLFNATGLTVQDLKQLLA